MKESGKKKREKGNWGCWILEPERFFRFLGEVSIMIPFESSSYTRIGLGFVTYGVVRAGGIAGTLNEDEESCMVKMDNFQTGRSFMVSLRLLH